MWKHFSYYRVFHSQFDESECQRIIDFHRKCEPVDARLSAHRGHLMRDSHLWWIYRTSSTDWLFQRVRRLVVKYNRDFRFDIETLANAAQLTRYREGQRYDWHMDVGDGESSHRKISVVVELSTPASRRGGGLEVFRSDDLYNSVRLGRGDVACFPSFVIHRARPVTRGTRWSLVFWIKGTKSWR